MHHPKLVYSNIAPGISMLTGKHEVKLLKRIKEYDAV